MRKVLVVEDDASVAALLRQLLEVEGFVTVFSTDVDSAWAELMDSWQTPDAAVVDLRLRGQDGWDLVDKMRKDERFSRTPIVILTGLPEAEVGPKATQLGCEYLGKPFSAAGLIDRLQTAMRNAGRSLAVRSVAVALLLDAFRVEGRVYVASEVARFSDAWEAIIRDARAFLPMTDVRITNLDGTIELAKEDFLEIRKSDVKAAVPRE